MQKVIIDTNVLVSALIQRSYPYLIVWELFSQNRFLLCLSDELLAEYYDVLGRPKFARFQDFYLLVESLLVDIELKATRYSPTIRLNLISDYDDNKILELAEESKADFIITGNINDFTFSTYKSTRIVTPKQFWDSFS